MSLARKIKFSVSGISGVGKRKTTHAAVKEKGYYYERKNGEGFGILKFCTAAAGFAILIAAIVFTTNFIGFGGGQDGTAMVFQSLTKSGEDLKYVDGISVENVPTKGEYLYSGGDEKEVLKLRFTSGGEIFRLKSLKVKVGGIDELGELIMKDSEGDEYRGKFDGDYVSFENLYFRIDEGSDLGLNFVAEFPEDLHFGQRIYFEIEDSRDIGLNLYGEEVGVKADYPLMGAYFTVVARKMVF
jgi:hypothetical protein